jgi:hypothetical protein
MLPVWLRSFTFGDVRQLDRLTGRSLAGPGRPVPAPGTGRWSLTWTPPSARCTATTSRAPATATPTGSATTSRCAALAGAASSVSRMGHPAENLHWAGLTEHANTRTRADLQRSVRGSACGHEPGPRGGLWRLLVVEREQRVSPTSPGEILARSAIAVRPRDDSRVTAEDPSLDQPCRPTLVMSCRARTRHTYDGTRRGGRMV